MRFAWWRREDIPTQLMPLATVGCLLVPTRSQRLTGKTPYSTALRLEDAMRTLRKRPTQNE